MQSYSMIFLDIDGTLLDSRYQVSPATRGLLSSLTAQGVPVVLCSARPPVGIRLVEEQAGVHGPMICYSGALTLSPQGQVVDQAPLDSQRALAFQFFVRAEFPGVAVNAYQYENWLVEPDQLALPWVLEEGRAVHSAPIPRPIDPSAPVHKLLCIGPPKDIASLRKKAAQAFEELNLVQSTSTYLEVLAPSASKERAVRALHTAYGVPQKAIVACGDYDADLEMLRYAGLGVAMGNATEAVKAAADLITETNDRQGVYLALKDLAFVPPPGSAS